ncbi:MAG: hypothetical protein V3T05_03600, partial [Myxococcota bacterium]
LVDADAEQPELITLDPVASWSVRLPVAVSYFEADAPQQRVIFREGGFDHEGNFYPFRSCPVPENGFSILDYDPIASTCSLSGLDVVIIADPITLQQATALGCSRMDSAFILSPGGVEPAGGALECVNEDVLLHAFDVECDRYEVYTLAGCSFSLTCEAPEWDIRDSPPDWWPCK